MHDLDLVESHQSLEQLDQDPPDGFLLDELTLLPVAFNFRLQVSIVSELHDYAETLSLFLEEGFLVRNHILMPKHVINLLLILTGWKRGS